MFPSLIASIPTPVDRLPRFLPTGVSAVLDALLLEGVLVVDAATRTDRRRGVGISLPTCVCGVSGWIVPRRSDLRSCVAGVLGCIRALGVIAWATLPGVHPRMLLLVWDCRFIATTGSDREYVLS